MSGAILLAHGGGTWDLSTYAYTSKSLSVASETTTPKTLRLSEDGSKAYVADLTNDRIYQYTLSTPFDVSTGSYASKSLDASSEVSYTYGLTISRDGSKFYVADLSTRIIYQYNLSTPWDASTGSYASKNFDCSSESSVVYAMFLSPDGMKLFVSGGFGVPTIYQYTLSTPFDISTASYDSKSISLGAPGYDLYIRNDGITVLFTINSLGTRYVRQRSMSTPWDISTLGSTEYTEYLSEDTAPVGICLSQDGLRMYISGETNNYIFQYSLD